MESRRRNNRFQIMIDLDSEDLTREQQIRNLTGRIKVCNLIFGLPFECNVLHSNGNTNPRLQTVTFNALHSKFLPKIL